MNNFRTRFSGVTIVAALAAERKILAAREKRLQKEVAGRKALSGPSSAEATFLQSGMGCAAARETALRAAAGTIIGNIGVSGALAPDVMPGTVILADAVYARGHRPAFMQAVYRPNAQLVKMLESVLMEQGIGYRRGRILCVDEPLLTRADKAKAHDHSGALAVDMESAGVAEAALQMGLPFFCLRVICDPAQRGFEEELLCGVDDRGNSRPLSLIAAVCRRPRLVGGLLRMAGDFSQAAAGMRRTWDAIRQPLFDFVSAGYFAGSAARPQHSNDQGR